LAVFLIFASGTNVWKNWLTKGGVLSMHQFSTEMTKFEFTPELQTYIVTSTTLQNCNRAKEVLQEKAVGSHFTEDKRSLAKARE
jgi:hypothetical protein